MSIMDNEGHSPTGFMNMRSAEPTGWRPIADAPRDGQWIIALCNDRYTLCRVKWSDGGWRRGGEQHHWYCDRDFARGGWIDCPQFEPAP